MFGSVCVLYVVRDEPAPPLRDMEDDDNRYTGVGRRPDSSDHVMLLRVPEHHLR